MTNDFCTRLMGGPAAIIPDDIFFPVNSDSCTTPIGDGIRRYRPQPHPGRGRNGYMQNKVLLYIRADFYGHRLHNTTTPPTNPAPAACSRTNDIICYLWVKRCAEPKITGASNAVKSGRAPFFWVRYLTDPSGVPGMQRTRLPISAKRVCALISIVWPSMGIPATGKSRKSRDH